ncbi:MAG: spore coat protein CotH [Lachnospiraceae bacterium]|nr:spore coat protein CotH [Lachnospiraceae bacterium]
MRRKKYTCFTALMMAAVIAFSTTACQTTSNSGSTDKAQETKSATAEETEYESKLFDTSYVHEINITIDEDDWEDLKKNPLEKTKYKVDITIDGETVEDVSFATKGNTSLTSVANDSDSNRYSFAINFAKYVDDQNYYGLNKLKLNNIYADATYMKEYLSYQIFRKVGVEAPLASYVNVKINGESQGLYLALEDIGESYLNRTQDGEGELYKPESEGLANMDKGMKKKENQDNQEKDEKDGDRPEFPSDGKMSEDGERQEPPSDMKMPSDGEKTDFSFGENGSKGFMPGESNAKGANLSYSDDEISSYSDIFDNAKTDADESDYKRVIAALKGLSEGKDIENYVDTEEVIRYFVAHNFVLNYDSYTGNMLHNYFLYEKDGKLSMLPWDYNLAFGGFSGGSNATSLVNTGIDSPLSGANAENRPMWNFIASNETYLNTYHELFDSLLKDYFESGDFEKEIEELYEMIKPYVEKDATAFYTSEEFEAGYTTLKQFITARAESIRAQLDEKLATISNKQDSASQIQATDIDVKKMGSQGGDKKNEKNVKRTL